MKKKDEGYTNIRIRENTREELRAIGRYGENMDDIVRRCLEAYKAITTSGGKVYNRIIAEKPIKEKGQQQPQQIVKTAVSETEEYKRQTQSPHLHIFDKDTAQPIPIGERSQSGKRNIRMEMIFPEIEFPAKKHELVELAKKDDDKLFLKVFNALPDKTFTTKDELEYSIIEVFNNNKDLTLMEGEKMIDFNLYNNKLVDFQLRTTTDELNEHTRKEVSKFLQQEIDARTNLLQELNKQTKKESQEEKPHLDLP